MLMLKYGVLSTITYFKLKRWRPSIFTTVAQMLTTRKPVRQEARHAPPEHELVELGALDRLAHVVERDHPADEEHDHGDGADDRRR
jgi:hypothetical protein